MKYESSSFCENKSKPVKLYETEKKKRTNYRNNRALRCVAHTQQTLRMSTLTPLRCCIVSSSSYSSSSSSSSTTTTSSSVKNKNIHRLVGRHQRAQRTTTRLRAKRDDEEKNDENNKLPEFEVRIFPPSFVVNRDHVLSQRFA